MCTCLPNVRIWELANPAYSTNDNPVSRYINMSLLFSRSRLILTATIHSILALAMSYFSVYVKFLAECATIGGVDRHDQR